MPRFYHNGEYDLVGTIVGVVERDEIITGDLIRAGDHIVGLPASGLHIIGIHWHGEFYSTIAVILLMTIYLNYRLRLAKKLLKNHQSYVEDCP